MTFPTTSVLDDFNRADEGPPMTGWTDDYLNFGQSGLEVISNECGPDGASFNGVSNWDTVFGADEELFITISTLPSEIIIIVRLVDAQTSNADGYDVDWQNLGTDTYRIRRIDNASSTQLGSTISGPNMSAGDKLGLEVIGTTITVYRHDGGSWSSVGSRTDGTYSAGGKLGVTIDGSAGTAYIDDFGGGEVVVAVDQLDRSIQAVIPRFEPALYASGRGAWFIGRLPLLPVTERTVSAQTIIPRFEPALYAPGRGTWFIGRLSRPPVTERTIRVHPIIPRFEPALYAPGRGTWFIKRRLTEFDLFEEQKTLRGNPVVNLEIGGHTLDVFVVAYRYRERPQSGGLIIWLDNRDDNFDDLATDYPNLTRGQEVTLERGLNVAGVIQTEELPRTWVESFQYANANGVGYFILTCIDWVQRLANFRFGSDTTFPNTSIKSIVSSILSEVGLTIDSGAFADDFNIDFEASPSQSGKSLINGLMGRMSEYLYAKQFKIIGFRSLAEETAAYNYVFTGVGHPLMSGTELAESSAKFNSVTVNGDLVSATVSNTAETDLGLPVRRLVIEDIELITTAQCTARATAELDRWLAQRVAGVLVARPNFRLTLYDVLTAGAPPWGGKAETELRVNAWTEAFGFDLWEQRITVGGLPLKAAQGRGETEDGQGIPELDERIIDTLEDQEVAIPGKITEIDLADRSVTPNKLADDIPQPSRQFHPLGRPRILDLTSTDADLKGFVGGFTDGQFGYFVPNNNGAVFGKVARVDLSDFSTVTVLDLTSTDADLKGFLGGFTDGRFGYFVPFDNGSRSGKVARVDLSDFSTVTVLDLTSTDGDLKGFSGGFTDGQFGYFVPRTNAANVAFGKVARVDLSDFSTVTVLDLTLTDADLVGFWGGFTDGRYGYFVPEDDPLDETKSKMARVDLSDFSTVTVLDLALTDVDLNGFRGGFTDGRYGYLVPYSNDTVGFFGKVARVKLSGFSEVTVLDLSLTDADLVGFIGGFTDGRYGYFVPNRSASGALGGKLARVDLAGFRQVSFIDLADTDADLAGSIGGFTDRRFGYIVANFGNSAFQGKIARIQVASGGEL